MGIKISEVRIENFRSLKYVDVKLGDLNILIGHNNSGKSNFLTAVNIGIRNRSDVEQNDIYWENNEPKSVLKKAVIDLKIVPDGKEFDGTWPVWFGTDWIRPDPVKEYVGIRTEIIYSPSKDNYITTKRPILNWGNTISDAKLAKQSGYRSEMIDYLNSYYIDASRDFSIEMKDKKSYFNLSTKTIILEPDKKTEIENELSELNSKIINSIEELKTTNETLSEIAPVIGIDKDSVVIEPLARDVNDLNRGFDVFIKDKNTLALPVSNYGMGTKSWVSFLSLKAYVNYVNKKLKKADPDSSDAYFMLLLEEPEAHLHPQAQKQLYEQLVEFSNQRIISTHSSSIISQCKPQDYIFVDKIDGSTLMKNFDAEKFDDFELNKIKREILRQKGELLFSNYVILCEGITEEQELPLYFEKKYGHNPSYYGISIVAVNGVNYSCFVKLLNMFSINWLILSDGENQTLNTLKGLFGKSDVSELGSIPNLFYYTNGDDIEKYLIRNNYSDEIHKAIDVIEGKGNYEVQIKNNEPRLFKEVETSDVCPTCKQKKKVQKPVEMFGLDKNQYFLYKYITRGNRKATLSEEIANQICKSSKKLPDIIENVLKKLKEDLKIK